jgi:hypothetical protein
MAIRKVPLFVAYLIGIYLIGWTVAYVLAFGLDFSYYFIYLYYVWTGPGEAPAIIAFYGFVISLSLIIFISIVWFLVRRHRNT